ncbi:cGMP-dependent protein kinase 1 [Eurosta solidaginis]|uniref:cGMP-dependent protein kinase 1 n=1 Tax=Eurosta solidaginis TaxID=178769 RepID=UPI003530BDB7
MACFPRLRALNRTKASFTPAEDTNKETLLNNESNTVQIGRYIRREEIALIAPEANKLNTATNQKQQSRSQEHIIDIRSNCAGNNNQNTENGNLINNNNSETKNVNTLAPQKFFSNKSNNLSRNNNISNNNQNTGKITTSNISNSTVQLKPVKGRRATALPSEAPNFDIEQQTDVKQECSKVVGDAAAKHKGNRTAQHVNDNQINGTKYNSNYNPDTPTTPSSAHAVHFFIGHQLAPAAAHEEDTVSGDSLDVGSYRSTTEVTVHSAQQQNTSIRANKSSSSLSHLTPTSNEATTYRNSNRIKCVASSPNLYGPQTEHKSKTKCWRKMRNTGSTNNNEALANDVHIPIPPPLPPEPLTTAASSASLISLRSNKAKRNSAAATSSNTATPQIEEGGISANVEFATPAFSYSTGDAGNYTTHSATNDKCSSEPQFFTLDEMLNLSTYSSLTRQSEILRDSGVQVANNTLTPKESDISDIPQAHRPEGGLIFIRPNIPAKKDVHIQFIEKDDNTRNLIRKAIERNDFLNNYMDKERKEMVIDAMEPTFYKKDSFIIHQNDEGSEIYVSETGYFEVIKGGKVVGGFGPTTVFGELAILYNANRLASVRATTNARVWKITRETFRQIMVLSESKERDENLTFLRAAPFLNDLSDEVLNKVVDLLQRKYYEPNACIVREGEVGNDFFIIRGGTVTIKKKNEHNVERVVDRRKRGDYFGEQALLNADRRQASVYADAPGTEVLKLDRKAFISYLGTIRQLHEKPELRKSAERKQSARRSEFDNEYAGIQLTDLKKVATLGAGAFGCVDLVAYKDKTFAVKILKKIDVIKQDQVEHVYSEKQVMMQCRSSPFIIELYKTFRNEKFVYFLMEACLGGDVWTVMSQRRFFDEKTAKFIAGCVVEAFDFLHSLNIIYRDLKPENLMLTTDGYCKLVDFGFAKHIPLNQKTNTFAGTPEYVAPEIILDRGHDRAVDYWALGILIFELLVGRTPFRGQTQIKIYQQILGGIDVIQMPSKIPRTAQNLIKHLCKQLPAERLGYQRRGILDIKKHSWFESLNWNKLKNKQLPSPIKRPITSNTDLQYFGPPGEENDYEPPDETSGWDIDF